jgi:hypothetical protein
VNAQTKIEQGRSPREAASELVKLYLPEANGEALALRARIHLARDQARSRSGYSTNCEARSLYGVAADVAGQFVFDRSLRSDDLFEVIKIVTWLFLAAGALERLESSDAD